MYLPPCPYIPPSGSPAYAQTANGVGVEQIEHCLSHLYNTRDELLVFMCGDFNARTSQENGRGPLDSVSCSGEDECVFERSSQDFGSNAFGTELLNLSSALQCSILNGIKTLGFDDSETYADSIDDPKQFWKEVKACIGFGRKQNVENKITKDQWLEHFMTVFNSGNNDRESVVEKWEKSSEHHSPNIESLDCPISEEEVTESIRKLKQGKAR